MSETSRRVRNAAGDARSNNDLVGGVFPVALGGESEPIHPLDEETLDEQASTQMGGMWEETRRDAD